jgi:hypothetical protein
LYNQRTNVSSLLFALSVYDFFPCIYFPCRAYVGARHVFQHCGTDATVLYAAEKKHDEKLLTKHVADLAIGRLGSATGIQYEPC